MSFTDKAPRYWKAIIAALPAVVLAGEEIRQAIDNGGADGTLDRGDVLTIILVAATALGVFAKRNARGPAPAAPLSGRDPVM